MHAFKTVLAGTDPRVTPDVEAVLHQAGAAIDAYFPTVAEAAERLPAGAEKRVVVAQAAGDADRPALQRLIDRFPANPVILLTPAAGTADELLAWVRMGVSQVVRLPLNPTDFRLALDRVARQSELHATAGLLVAVAGAAEGCGATTVAFNLATEAADRLGKTVLLAEAPHRLGRLAVLLNVQPAFTTADLETNPAEPDLDTLRKAVSPVRDRLGLLSGPYQALPTSPQSSPRVLGLLGPLRQLADVVIIDMPYQPDDVYFRVLAGVDHVVVVADQNIPTLHALTLFREAAQSHHVTARRHLVINRYRPDHPGATRGDIREVLRGEPYRTIHEDTEAVLTALNEGEAVRDVSPDSPFVADVYGLAGELFGPAPVAPTRPVRHGFIERVGELFARH